MAAQALPATRSIQIDGLVRSMFQAPETPELGHYTRQRIAGHARLVGCAGIAGHLVEALVTTDGGDLVGAAPSLGESPACRLAQPVRRAALEADTFAPLGEPCPERLRGETAPALVK